MSDDRPALLQGTLDMLVLRALTWGAMHGFGVSTLIRERTAGDIVVVDAALYKSLYRLERDGLVASSWDTTENNRRARYYRLTPQGRARLKQDLTQWRTYSAAVERLMGSP